MRTILRLVPLLFAAIVVTGCCKENVKILVLAGHQTSRACTEAADQGKSSILTVICGGNEVTICWASNKQDVKIDPLGITSHGTPIGDNFAGVEYFKPTASVTVKATASDCASASQDVTVISGDTPVTFDAGWSDAKCAAIDYTFDPLFVDPAAKSISITALWTPMVTDANGNLVACTTPPFLDGFKKPELFGFKVDDPNVTKAFSQQVGLAGDWLFIPKFTCPVFGGDVVCNQNAVFPFSTTVRCPAQ
jgi:hypothetical protein